MTQISQIIAVRKGVKARAERDLTDIYQQLQKPALLSGLARTYQPKDEEGQQYPPESTRVQVDAETALLDARSALTRLFNVQATLDWANCAAKADVVVEGVRLLEAVPVTYLLFLDKSLANLRTLLAKLPTLDPADEWERDPNTNSWVTPVRETHKKIKVPRAHVLYDATKEHPAQVQPYSEDVVEGSWFAKKFSGAVLEMRRQQLLDRLDSLAAAVKFAREQANTAPVEDIKPADKVFDYLFGS